MKQNFLENYKTKPAYVPLCTESKIHLYSREPYFSNYSSFLTHFNKHKHCHQWHFHQICWAHMVQLQYLVKLLPEVPKPFTALVRLSNI